MTERKYYCSMLLSSVYIGAPERFVLERYIVGTVWASVGGTTEGSWVCVAGAERAVCGGQSSPQTIAGIFVLFGELSGHTRH
jgi:hypothetical protein